MYKSGYLMRALQLECITTRLEHPDKIGLSLSVNISIEAVIYTVIFVPWKNNDTIL
jgi:hypothetical protein